MSGDRSLVLVVGLSWLVMVGIGASLPAEYQGWFRSAVGVGTGLVAGLGRLVQGLVGSVGGDSSLVVGFVGLSPVLVGVGVGGLFVAFGARRAARWVFADASIVGG